MSLEQSSDLAKAIADGRRPDFESHASDNARLNAYRLLADIAEGFRRDEAPESGRQPLFTWRHLQVIEEIGAGAFGTVYRAYDPTLRRDVALKVARGDPERRIDPRMVIAEARSLARLRHPNVLAVHGADEKDGQVGVWCDLLRGRTLAEALDEEEFFGANDALALAIPLAGALALVHRRGLIHGDVKLANIMLERDGTPVLMDFGAAREGPGRGAAFGSPLYMAPEQFAGRPASPASDIYAFGVLLYVALAGRHPLPAESLDELQDRHASRETLDFRVLPFRFRSLLRAMLSRAPADRPDAVEVARRLERISTARARWLRRGALAAVVGSLAIGIVASLLAWRSAVESRDRIERVKDLMAEAAESVVPTRQSGPTSVVAMYQKMAELIEERLVDYPAALAEMRVVTGVGLGKLGETQQGLELAEAGITLLEEVRGDVPGDIGSSWLEVATLRAMVEDIDGTEEAIRRALAAFEGVETEEAAAERLVARNRLALLLGQQGRWHEEIAAAEELLADRRAIYGEDSIRLAVDYHNLAGALATVGDLESALANEARAADLLRAEGDEDSVRMGFVQFARAGMLIDAGRLDEARQALATVARIYEANLPPGHRNFAFLAEEQTRLRVEAGEGAAVVPELERLLALDGEDFAQTRLKAGRSLARVRMDQERWADAARLLREVQRCKPARYRPLTDYFEAAIAYAAFRSGKQGAPPIEALDAALASLSDRDLTRIDEYARLQRWRRELTAKRPGL